MHSSDFDSVAKAIKKGDLSRVRQRLESGTASDLVNRHGWTLLMSAAFEGDTAIGTELIRNGAQLDLRNKDGWTALPVSVPEECPQLWQNQ
jgi:ankyrin repeat protein